MLLELFPYLSDPTLWLGLLTLVAMEIILGIDNLVFIAILADKLPPEQRDRARIIGLSCALVMRLFLLAIISWVVTLTEPLFLFAGQDFSGRDLIMIFGGLFLLFKATMELHERLEGQHKTEGAPRAYASFGMVITQIVVLDAIFSIDSVITAIGMVDHLPVMMVAVVIAVMVMMVASKPLTNFVSSRPTVVVLCLGFLMMIGLSLLAEGFDLHIPKGYLYAAIGFSVLVEAFNQFARSKRRRDNIRRPLRERTAEAVLHLLGASADGGVPELSDLVTQQEAAIAFNPSEQAMIRRVLGLAERTVKSIMTPRTEVESIHLNESLETITQTIIDSSYSRMVVYSDASSEPLGVVAKKELLHDMLQTGSLELRAAIRPALAVPETKHVLSLLEDFKNNADQIAFVVDEFGSFEGIVTLTDVLETIAGDMREEHETEELLQIRPKDDGSYDVDGRTDINDLTDALQITLPEGDYHTAAGALLHVLRHVPSVGDATVIDGWAVRVVVMDGKRIDLLHFSRVNDD